MNFSFNPDDSSLVFAKDYLGSAKGRGRVMQLKHLGLAYFVLSDCIYAGDDFQVLLPLVGSSLPYLLKESCQYVSGEFKLAAQAAKCLEAAVEVREVDEAAPFYLPSAGNLWHWTSEHLPSLLALEDAGYSGKYIVPLHSKLVRESLDMHGIAPERLLPSRACYRVKMLMLPQRLPGFELPAYMPLVSFTRQKLMNAAGTIDGSKRVYVRRIGRRKPLNEDEVLAVLAGFDFEVMVPEELSLREQWRFMTNVECSVMPHGANSTLTLLQKPGSGAVELFGNRYISYNNLHAVRLLRLNYHALVEDLDISSAPPGLSLADFLWGGYEADMLVDTVHLRILLESMLG